MSDDEPRSGISRWVKVAGIVVAIVALIVVVALLIGGGGGHTPRRHGFVSPNGHAPVIAGPHTHAHENRAPERATAGGFAPWT